jgi:hypothetical protein
MDFENYANKGLNIGEETLAKLSTLTRRMSELEEELDKLDRSKKDKMAELDRIRDFELSDLLLSNNVTSLKLATGEKVEIKQMIFASITEANSEKAFSWLRENKFEAIIKNKAEVDLGKGGSDEKIGPLAKLVEDLGLVMKVKETVNPQTLKAFVKEQMGQGRNIPLDLFSVHTVNRASVER